MTTYGGNRPNAGRKPSAPGQRIVTFALAVPAADAAWYRSLDPKRKKAARMALVAAFSTMHSRGVPASAPEFTGLESISVSARTGDKSWYDTTLTDEERLIVRRTLIATLAAVRQRLENMPSSPSGRAKTR